jgi:four helix bundle protein
VAKGDDIQERLIDFAVRVMRVSNNLPRTRAARHVSEQLLHAGTSPAAQYAEARGAESTSDFVHKLKICLKELNETMVWLAIAGRSEMLPSERLADLVLECTELARIINASITTAKAKIPKPNRLTEDVGEYDTTDHNPVIDN